MTISFIGGGVMAESFISGILRENLIGADQIFVSDPIQDRRQYLTTTYKVNCVKGNLDILQQEGKILLAVKPQTLPEVYQELKGKIDALTQSSMKLGEIIYKEAQQEAQKQQAKQPKGGPSKGEKKNTGKKEEKVVDAEFEEVDKKNNKKSA